MKAVRFALVAGAAIAQVCASPLRVVVVSTSHQELPVLQKFRFGHALGDHPLSISNQPITPLAPPHGHCPWGKHIKDKAIQISNAFRHALGLPLIETMQPGPGSDVHGGMLHILPFAGPPPTFIKVPEIKFHQVNDIDRQEVVHRKGPCRTTYHHHPHHFHKWGSTFMMRIHNAIMALGPWEGRAVAFVLGCGIGVLIRMFWVLTVVAYRSIRGEHDEEYTQLAVVEEYVDAEDIVVPPPTYTISDEKEQIRAKDATEN